MKKKILIPLIAMVIVIAAVVVLLPNLFLKSSNKSKQKKEAVDPKVIMEDYDNGKISIDEFVKLNIDNPNDYVPIDLFVYNNIDQLSESTLKYYLEQINLPEVTFDPDKENTDEPDPALGLYAKPVYADEKLENLNQVVLSPKGNFVVWYTTTGKSAITKEQAESIAKALDESIDGYKDRFGCEYKFESKFLSRGNRYKDQQEKLKNNNIDIGCLESAMQVYVYEYNEGQNTPIAQYKSRKVASKIQEIALDIYGEDDNGSIALPYIRIRTSELSDSESANQVINHELFHHYQLEVLEGHSNPITDMRIWDATANWASALVTPKESSNGFLNKWAHTARKYSDRLFSEEMINAYKSEGGETHVSYALFVYLYHYSNFVENGTQKILESIYKQDGFEYLYKAATLDELAKVQEICALKNINQKYSNKNFVDDPELRSDWDFPIKAILTQEIDNGCETYSTELPRLAMEFYRVTNSPAEAKLEKNNNIAAYLFKEQNGSFEVIDMVASDSNEYVFDLTEYDYMYLVIANVSLTSQNSYQLTITPAKKTDPTETRPEDTTPTSDPTTGPDASTSDPQESTGGPQEPPKGASFLSYETTSHWNEEILKDIETYYFDENDMVCYRTVTLYIVEEEGLLDVFYQNVAQSPNLYTNIKVEGNMIQYDYTAYALELTHDNERSKETIIGIYESQYPEGPGGGNVDGYVRTDYNPHE